MKLNRKLLLPLGLLMATAQFTSMNAGAAEVCDTLESCRQLREQLERRIGVILTGAAPSLTDMARNVDGHVRELSQYDADRYCHDLGLRLPTSRELAAWAHSRGAVGLYERKDTGYQWVDGGSDDDFYYRAEGYQPPSAEAGDFSLWASYLNTGLFDSIAPLLTPDGVFSGAVRNTSGRKTARCVRANSSRSPKY